MLQASPERPPISPRELEIARAYTGGQTYRQIADDLGIAPATVRTHINNIYRKLEVTSKIELLHRIEPAPVAVPVRKARRWQFPLVLLFALIALAAAFAIRPMPKPAAAPASQMRALAMVPFLHDGNPAARDALARDLIEHLANRVELYVVVPSNSRLTMSSETYANRLGQALNLRFVLSGQTASRDGGLSVSATLYDRVENRIVWRDEIKSPEFNIFAARLALLDSLARSVGLPQQTAVQMRCLEMIEHDTQVFDKGAPAPGYWLQGEHTRYCGLDETGPR